MARTFTPRVNRHVTWITAAGKLKSATITAVTSSTVVDLRLSRTGTTIAGAVKATGDADVSKWMVTDLFQNV